MSNVDSYKGVFGATLADGIDTECCAFLGYTPMLQGCVEAAEAKELEQLGVGSTSPASGPTLGQRAVLRRSEAHAKDLAPHREGRRATPWSTEVGRPSSRGGIGHALADSAFALRERALQHVKPWRQRSTMQTTSGSRSSG